MPNEQDFPETLKEMREKLEFIEEALDMVPEDSLFANMGSEDRSVLAHALFWVMTRNAKGQMEHGGMLFSLRRFEGDLLTAYLTEHPDFPEVLHLANMMMDILLAMYADEEDENTKRMLCMVGVACGLAREMREDACNEILDDIDFYHNRPKCRRIEAMLPYLNRLVRQQEKFESENEVVSDVLDAYGIGE